MFKIILAGAALALTMPAVANTAETADPYGATSISKGRYEHIERKLLASYQKGDRSPEVLLNLAAIRLKQQRGAEARAIFSQVLEQPNVDMATLTGSAWSHDLAHRGMSGAMAMAD